MTRTLTFALVVLLALTFFGQAKQPGKPPEGPATLTKEKGKEKGKEKPAGKGDAALYSDRRLKDWLADLKDSDVLIREEAIEVLAQVGAPAKAALVDLKRLLKDSNRNLRIRAALAIWKIDGKADGVVEVLAEGMQEASQATRREALVALAAIGPDAAAATPVIIDCLDDPDYTLRNQAATALQKVGKAAMPALLKGLESKNATVRQNVIIHISSYMLGSVGKEHIPALTARLKDDSLRTRVEAARLLWSLNQTGAAVVAALLEGVKAPDANLQSLVLQTLQSGSAKPMTLLPVLEVCLRNPNVYIKTQAARVLYEVEKKPDRVLPIYMDILRDNNLNTRYNWSYAISGLAQINGDARPALPRLIEMLKMRDYYAPYEIRTVLANIGKPTINPLVDILRDVSLPANANSVEIAVTVLSGLGAPAAKAVIPLLNDGNFTVRHRAVRVLADIGPDAKDALAKLIELFKDSSTTVRDAAIAAVGNMGPAGKDAIPKLIEMARGSDVSLRTAGLRALARLNPQPKEVVPICLPLLKENNALLRQAAVDLMIAVAPRHREVLKTTLEMLGDPSQQTAGLQILARLGPDAAPAVPKIIPILKSPSNPLRTQAAGALGAIGPAARSATPELLELLSHADASVVNSAALALGQIKPEPKQALGKLIDYVKKSRNNTAIFTLLGEYGDKASAAFPALLDAVKDSSAPAYPRGIAAVALAQVDPARAKKEALDELHKLLPHTDLQLNVAHALLLIDDSDKKAVRILREGLSNASTRAGVCVGLAKIGSPGKQFLPELRKLSRDPYYYTKTSAAYAAYQVSKDPKEGLPVLVATLKDPTPYAAGYAAYYLGEIGRDARTALPGLRVLRGHRETYARTQASTAIAKIEKAVAAAQPKAPAPDEAPAETTNP